MITECSEEEDKANLNVKPEPPSPGLAVRRVDVDVLAETPFLIANDVRWRSVKQLVIISDYEQIY